MFVSLLSAHGVPVEAIAPLAGHNQTSGLQVISSVQGSRASSGQVSSASWNPPGAGAFNWPSAGITMWPVTPVLLRSAAGR